MATLTRTFEKRDVPAAETAGLEAVIDDIMKTVPPLMQKLMTRSLERTLAAIRAGFPQLEPHLRRDPWTGLICAAVRCIDGADNRLHEIDAHLAIQEAALRFATAPAEREAVFLETCRFLRRTPAQLRGDRRAFRRWMDWEAILELARRAQHSAHRHQQTLVFLASRALARCGTEKGRTIAELMERTGFTQACARAMQQRLPIHVEREWVDAIVTILRAHRTPKKPVPLEPAILHALAVRAQDAHADVWVQCGALHAWLIASTPDALRLARQRLRGADPKNRDDVFVRRFLVEKAADVLDEMQTLDLIQSVFQSGDPSPHVRQGAILALGDQDPDRSWPVMREHVLMREDWDPVPEVRAAISLTLGKWASRPRGAEIALQEWRLLFDREQEAMPLRVALKHAGNVLENLVGFGRLDPKLGEQFALELLEKGVGRSWAIPVRCACEDMLERVRVAALPGFAHFRDHVAPLLLESNRTEQVDVSVYDAGEDGEEVFGRLLAWLARRHYGLYAMPRRHGWRVTVGQQYRWRLWRFLFETLSPAPDKRQAFRHTSARRYEGILRAHALGLGEESPTKVPGEPVQMSSEGGWRRFLPLPDDFLDSLEFGPCRVFSSEGIAYVSPPEDRRARRRLKWTLSRDYPKLAALREQSRFGNPEAPPSAYVDRMRALGFGVSFRPHPPPELSWVMPYFNAPQLPQEAPPA